MTATDYVLLPALFPGDDLIDLPAMFDRFEAELETRKHDDPMEYSKFETKPTTFPLAEETAAQDLIAHPGLHQGTEAAEDTSYRAMFRTERWDCRTGSEW